MTLVSRLIFEGWWNDQIEADRIIFPTRDQRDDSLESVFTLKRNRFGMQRLSPTVTSKPPKTWQVLRVDRRSLTVRKCRSPERAPEEIRPGTRNFQLPWAWSKNHFSEVCWCRTYEISEENRVGHKTLVLLVSCCNVETFQTRFMKCRF